MQTTPVFTGPSREFEFSAGFDLWTTARENSSLVIWSAAALANQVTFAPDQRALLLTAALDATYTSWSHLLLKETTLLVQLFVYICNVSQSIQGTPAWNL